MAWNNNQTILKMVPIDVVAALNIAVVGVVVAVVFMLWMLLKV